MLAARPVQLVRMWFLAMSWHPLEMHQAQGVTEVLEEVDGWVVMEVATRAVSGGLEAKRPFSTALTCSTALALVMAVSLMREWRNESCSVGSRPLMRARQKTSWLRVSRVRPVDWAAMKSFHVELTLDMKEESGSPGC